jgi:hypothetical protein
VENSHVPGIAKCDNPHCFSSTQSWQYVCGRDFVARGIAQLAWAAHLQISAKRQLRAEIGLDRALGVVLAFAMDQRIQ